jgi:hypothetical protein
MICAINSSIAPLPRRLAEDFGARGSAMIIRRSGPSFSSWTDFARVLRRAGNSARRDTLIAAGEFDGLPLFLAG